MRLIDISPYEIGAMSCSVQTTKQESATTMSVTQINTNTIPTVDAAPVTHGEWSDGADIIEVRLHRHYFRCKVCHKFADSFIGGTENWWCSEKPNYCPNCGAKMDGGKDAEE